MTPIQQEALGIINGLLLRAAFAGWCKPSFVMAHCEIESDWDASVHSADGLGSIGLCQVLPGHGGPMGVHGDQSVPANSILAGMLYMAACHRTLGDPYYPNCVEAYNEGIGNVERHRPDPAYAARWKTAQAKWAYVDEGAPPVTPVAAAVPVAKPSAPDDSDADAEALNAQELNEMRRKA